MCWGAVRVHEQWQSFGTSKGHILNPNLLQLSLDLSLALQVNDIAFGAPSVAIDEKTGLYRLGLSRLWLNLTTLSPWEVTR